MKKIYEWLFKITARKLNYFIPIIVKNGYLKKDEWYSMSLYLKQTKDNNVLDEVSIIECGKEMHKESIKHKNKLKEFYKLSNP